MDPLVIAALKVRYSARISVVFEINNLPTEQSMSNSISSRLTPANALQMSTAEVDRHYRSLQESGPVSDIRVAFLGNHTLEPLQRATAVLADAYGYRAKTLVGPFDQYFQELLDESSGTLALRPDAIVLSLSLRYLSPQLVFGGADLSHALVDEALNKAMDTIVSWTDLALSKTDANIYICNFARPPSTRFGPADASIEVGEEGMYATLNQRVAGLTRRDPRVHVVDASHAVSCAGLARGWTPRMYYLAKIEWGTEATLWLARGLARALRAQIRPARKCLVLDMDNTLWGGVLGEDGPDGIKVGKGDPTSEAFSAFQAAILDMKARGVLLAACSKNNLSDVEEMFRLRDDLPLSLEDFAYKAINWDPKHINIRSIAKALNIGLDSLVFVDDNPVECELVRQTLPEVLTLQLPEDPTVLADFLYDLPDFDKLRFTAEDARKTQQYAENFKREELQKSIGDLTTFLESLETQVNISIASTGSVSRVHQLFNKTNQFNTTTIRYQTSEITEFISGSDKVLYTISAADRFGDLGMIGVCLIRIEQDRADVDSFVMSCRALGRGIETAAMNCIKQDLFSRRGSSEITARFLPTTKNKPSANFFVDQGFETVAANDGGAVSYRLRETDAAALPVPGITVKFEGHDHE